MIFVASTMRMISDQGYDQKSRAVIEQKKTLTTHKKIGIICGTILDTL